jgi:rare lipoprotein A
MTSRARRIVPGMLASLLLAAPLLSSPARADTVPAAAAPPKSLEQRRPAPRPKHHAARRRAPAAATPAAATPAAAAPAATAAFFDDAAPRWHQRGIASWYGGPRWQGRLTASGARYEQDALTAAHATLPLGSQVRVALDGTGRSVIVTINDRPGSRSRVIDLSRGAARALGILQAGVARVTLSTPP